MRQAACRRYCGTPISIPFSPLLSLRGPELRRTPGVSAITPPPPAGIRSGTFSFAWARGEGESARDLRAAGFWMLVLFFAVAVLWWLFR